jgi:general secretion pathway protein D
LNDLCNAAGFIVRFETPVQGNVSVIGQHLSQDEVVDLLNSALNRNGYAAIRKGRTLTIMSREASLYRDNPVQVLADPAAVPDNDEIATYIVPIRFIEARELASEVSQFSQEGTRIIANEAANAIIITDVQSRIKHLMQIIKAIDSSAEQATELRIVQVTNADCQEMATLISTLFPDQSNSSSQLPIQIMGGPGGGPFGGMAGGPAAGNSGNSSDQRLKKRQVTAVAEPRTSSVAIVASTDLINQVVDLVRRLDHPSQKDLRAQVFALSNADPQDVLPVLQQLFQTSSSGTSSSSSSQSSMLQYRLQQFSQASSSTLNNPFSTGSSSGTGGGTSGR